MADNKSKKPGRLSKGHRTYVRRLKQAARKEASTNSPQTRPVQAVRAPKQQDPTKEDS